MEIEIEIKTEKRDRNCEISLINAMCIPIAREKKNTDLRELGKHYSRFRQKRRKLNRRRLLTILFLLPRQGERSTNQRKANLATTPRRRAERNSAQGLYHIYDVGRSIPEASAINKNRND